jgi:hypothetical protein
MIGAVAGGVVGVLILGKAGSDTGLDLGLDVVFVICCMMIGIFGEVIADIWTEPPSW